MTRESKIEAYFNAMVKEVLRGRTVKQGDPMQSGLPDRIALIPCLPMEFCELKSEGKPLGLLQEQWRDWLILNDFRYSKIDSLTEVDKWIALRRKEQASYE